MNYSEFLFTQLLRANSKRFDEMEYDLLYKYGHYYSSFEGSTYDDEDKGEYECIEEFLSGSSYITMAAIKEMTHRDEDIYFITGLEYGVRDLDSVDDRQNFEVKNIIAIEFNLI